MSCKYQYLSFAPDLVLRPTLTCIFCHSGPQAPDENKENQNSVTNIPIYFLALPTISVDITYLTFNISLKI